MRLQSALRHYVDDIILILFFGYYMVHLHRFAHDFADGHTRRKRRIRILEDHLEVRTHLSQSVAFEFFDVLAFEYDFAARRFVQAENGSAESRFSAARFAHYTDCVPRLEFERNAVHRFEIHGVALYKALGYRKVLLKVVDDKKIIVVLRLLLVFYARRDFGINDFFFYVDIRRCNFNRFNVVLNAYIFIRHTISPLSMQR